MSPLRCGCGAECIPGPLWTPADSLAWAREHEGHALPEAPPRAMSGELPANEARALARDLRAGYVVGLSAGVRAGWLSLFVKPRRAA